MSFPVDHKEHNELFIRGKNALSVDELLSLARQESVLLVSGDGSSFVLEEADNFDREVARLLSSEKFMRFLEKRSKEKGVISIDQLAKKLGSTDA